MSAAQPFSESSPISEPPPPASQLSPVLSSPTLPGWGQAPLEAPGKSPQTSVSRVVRGACREADALTPARPPATDLEAAAGEHAGGAGRRSERGGARGHPRRARPAFAMAAGPAPLGGQPPAQRPHLSKVGAEVPPAPRFPGTRGREGPGSSECGCARVWPLRERASVAAGQGRWPCASGVGRRRPWGWGRPSPATQPPNVPALPRSAAA